MAVSREVRAYVSEQAAKLGLPAELALAVIDQESGGRVAAVGKPNRNGTRDYGLMQINENNLSRFGLTRETALTDWKTNADAGLSILSEAVRDQRGDIARALAQYKGGPKHAALGPGKWEPATQRYIEKIGGKLGLSGIAQADPQDGADEHAAIDDALSQAIAGMDAPDEPAAQIGQMAQGEPAPQMGELPMLKLPTAPMFDLNAHEDNGDGSLNRAYRKQIDSVFGDRNDDVDESLLSIAKGFF